MEKPSDISSKLEQMFSTSTTNIFKKLKLCEIEVLNVNVKRMKLLTSKHLVLVSTNKHKCIF